MGMSSAKDVDVLKLITVPTEPSLLCHVIRGESEDLSSTQSKHTPERLE